MTIAIVAILSLLCLATVFTICGKRGGNVAADKVACTATECSSCGETAAECGRVRHLKEAIKPIQYYDDEELDSYKGRRSDSYTDKEVAQFAYILRTMRPNEVGGWAVSLEQRGINAPEELRDEMIMMIEDGNT